VEKVRLIRIRTNYTDYGYAGCEVIGMVDGEEQGIRGRGAMRDKEFRECNSRDQGVRRY